MNHNEKAKVEYPEIMQPSVVVGPVGATTTRDELVEAPKRDPEKESISFSTIFQGQAFDKLP